MGKASLDYKAAEDDIVRIITQFSGGHQIYQIFQDWIEVSAIAVSNSVDYQEGREERYLQIISQYKSEEQNQIVKLFVLLTEALTRAVEMGTPCDVLGSIFHRLELHNKYAGQFFTPSHICELMSEVALDGEKCKKDIDEKGYITVYEPASGSGAMVIGMAAAMVKNKMNYQQQLCVTACDVDIKCVHMTYLQLSLYHIPAVVIHGDSLTLEEWSRWYTPAYMMGQWMLRERINLIDISDDKERNQKSEIEILPNIEQVSEYAELTVEENGQISLL